MVRDLCGMCTQYCTQSLLARVSPACAQCAAMGKLPGQRSPTVIFAKAPSELDIAKSRRERGRPLNKCGGYSPSGCWAGAYANDDIYFLES